MGTKSFLRGVYTPTTPPVSAPDSYLNYLEKILIKHEKRVEKCCYILQGAPGQFGEQGIEGPEGDQVSMLEKYSLAA
jgi:hypothetical protein